MLKNQFTLKWLKVPGYSVNIPLDITLSLKKSFGLLAASRMISDINPNHRKLRTYYFIIQSLIDRCRLYKDVSNLQSLVQSEVLVDVRQEVRLNLRTEEAWMKGESVLAYSFSSKILRIVQTELLEFKKWKENLRIQLFITLPLGINPLVHLCCFGERPVAGTNNGLHLVELWSKSKKKNTVPYEVGYSDMTVKDLLDPSFHFLLAKDHGFDSTFSLSVSSLAADDYIHLIRLTTCDSELVSNMTPFILQSSLPPPTREPATGFVPIKCLEFEDRYDLEIGIRGFIISNPDGMLFSYHILGFKNSSKKLFLFPDL